MTPSLAGAALVLAAALDVAWGAVSMTYSDGYSRLWWTAAAFVSLAGFVWLLGRALQVLPVGTAYAVWTGLGAVGSAGMGAVLFGEALSAARLAGVALALAGIAG